MLSGVFMQHVLLLYGHVIDEGQAIAAFMKGILVAVSNLRYTNRITYFFGKYRSHIVAHTIRPVTR